VKIEFTKLQALGNDYIYVDGYSKDFTKVKKGMLSKEICDRHFGVGADGLIFVMPGKGRKFKMDFYNPDGSPAEMCGNGIRCLVRFIYENLEKNKYLEIETKKRIIKAEILSDEDDFKIKVDMGEPVLERKKIPVKGSKKFAIGEKLKIENKSWEFTSVSMGNPHTVVFVPHFDFFWQGIGKKIENYHLFPEKTNVAFVKVLNPKKMELRIWERAAGETLASGTGSSASLTAGVLTGRLERKVVAIFQKGKLDLQWSEKDNHIYVIGPAVKVFSGIYEY
jgi:diaminopimelate epimerase